MSGYLIDLQEERLPFTDRNGSCLDWIGEEREMALAKVNSE